MGKKAKLPKRLLGVKLPKAIRKGPIGNFLGSSGGQIMIAEALLAATAYYAARRIDPDSPIGGTLRRPMDGLRAGRDWSRGTSDRLARAVRAGVQAFRASKAKGTIGLSADVQNREAEAVDAGEGQMDADAPAKKSESSRRQARRDATTGPH